MSRRKDPTTIEQYRALESEADFQSWVVGTAKLRGWMVGHLRDARTQDDVTGLKGLPDLVLARGGLVILAELKSENGEIRKSQKPWLEASGNHVWRPSMRAKIEAMLL